jgi:hypothetical protein
MLYLSRLFRWIVVKFVQLMFSDGNDLLEPLYLFHLLLYTSVAPFHLLLQMLPSFLFGLDATLYLGYSFFIDCFFAL